MIENLHNPTRKRLSALILVLLATLWVTPAFADQKNKQAAAPNLPDGPPKFDISNIEWPQPPAIARVRYLDYFSAEKKPPEKQQDVKRKSWMDRMAGVDPNEAAKRAGTKPRFALGTPYGLAVDSKGLVYVADTKVGAVFIFDPENKDTEFIKHGVDAKFGRIFGLAIDDADRLFVTDGEYNHVLVFDKNHKLEGQFGDGVMNDPAGMAIDEENRFLYVANTGSDQILVYDADTFKLLRKIGTPGKDHALTDPGDFSKPTNVAVDKDGNLYVSDTMNDRVEEFDADGQFIRTFGKNGDGPGEFTRPKGIAVDSDGHVWVADAGMNRVQIFTPEGDLRLIFGGFGWLPGQFEALADITIDSKHRVFTSEQFLGRVQMFRYITDPEAQVEYDRRAAEVAKKSQLKPAQNDAAKPADQATPAPAPAPGAPKVTPPATAPAASATGKPS
jgi:sugar lactone lactonase YvrE